MTQKVDNFKTRASILLIILAIWTFVTICASFYFSVAAREKYLAMGNKIAVRYGEYYPGRGRILDKNGVVLAWTEKYFDLCMLSTPQDEQLCKIILAQIQKVVPDATLEPSKDAIVLMKRNISPHQIVKLEELLATLPELKVIPREERKIVDYQEVKSLIGNITIYNGQCRGISGIESKFNYSLSGKSGLYEVMLDRHKNWIPGTWKLKRKAVPGKDIQLDIALSEIRQKGAK